MGRCFEEEGFRGPGSASASGDEFGTSLLFLDAERGVCCLFFSGPFVWGTAWRGRDADRRWGGICCEEGMTTVRAGSRRRS